jgi:hypothetical protein
VIVGVAGSINYPITIGPWPQTGQFGGGVVTVMNMLPKGVDRFGEGTAGCRGVPAIGVTKQPDTQDPRMGITCVRAPQSGQGFLFLAAASPPSGVVAGGVTLYVDPAAFVTIPVSTTALGGVLVHLAHHPVGVPSTVYAQFVFPDTCAPGHWSASNALSIVLQ